MDPFSGALFAGLGFSLILMAGLPSVLMLVALVYVALRVRDAKAEHPDPELGLKTAYWLLYTLGILLIHFGLTTLFAYWLTKLEITGPAKMFGPGGGNFGRPMGGNFGNANDDWSPASRIGWALVVAGAAIAIAFYLIGKLGTRDSEWPSVRRVYTGSRIAVAGLIVVFAFTFLVVMQFQKEIPGGGIYEAALASLAVWLPSLAIHVFLFRWGGPQAYHVPLEERSQRRKPKRYTEDAEMPEVAPEAGEPAGEPPPRRRRREGAEDDSRHDGDDEAPRRRRPRDED